MSEPGYVDIDASSLVGNDAIEVRLGETAWAIVLRREGRVHAYMNVCPHQGRALNFAPGEFIFTDKDHLMCAAHGATFDPTTGEALGGPCEGAYLRALEVVERDGRIWVRTPTN